MENHLDINSQFIPYNLAVKLKELGFNEDCFGYYGEPLIGKQERFSLRLDWTPESYPFKNELHCLAPLWQQAESFLRTKMLFHIIFRGDGWYWEVLHKGHFSKNGNFKTYEEARLACLEKLIEIVENE